MFSEQKSALAKIVGQNHQYLGVNNAIEAMLTARRDDHGRGGVFWQTQGSGKSFSMVFFAQKVLRKLPGNWTFVVVTDRIELDEQIAKTFKAVGAVSETEGDRCHAASGAELRELLRGNHRFVFTLIHKFQSPEELCDRSDLIVLTDEAHRSQYDTLALNMRSALPNAIFDILTRPGPELSSEERAEVKKVATHLLERLRSVLSLDWRQQIQARAKVRMAIEDELDQGLPRAYTTDLYEKKCSSIFEHVYDSYFGESQSVYSRSVG